MSVMQRVPKAKSAKTKRILDQRGPLVVENTKKAFFVKGNNGGLVISEFLKDMQQLKKPDTVMYKRKNPIIPFEDCASLEFYSKKTDCSLFMFGNNSKKRPDNIVMGRMFNHEVLDMIEFQLLNYEPSIGFENVTRPVLGSKPCFVFSGELFEKNPEYAKVKSIILDFFRGRVVDKVALQGLSWVICVTACEEQILFRTYNVLLKKSGTRIPRVELEDIGPHMDMKLKRTKFAPWDMMKEALKKPKVLKEKKEKNISYDKLGNKYATVHMEKQDLNELQTRKVKALKRSKEEDEDDEEEIEAANSPKKLKL